MSTRYVWDQCNIKYTTTYSLKYDSEAYEVGNFDDDNDPDPIACGSYSINQSTGRFVSGSPSMRVTDDNMHNSTIDTYRYLFLANYRDGAIDYTTLYDAQPGGDVEDYYWWRSGSNHQPQSMYLYGYRKPDRLIKIYKLASKRTASKGSVIKAISGSSSGQYPSNGVSGSYWYAYSGSDSIDPTSISTVVDRWLCIGQQLTITASPSTSIKYGGTTSYQYQVQLNGGSWTNIGSKTTATSINYNIPEGTTSIRFQVLASDNMGFTSTTWVQSPTYQVSKFVPGIAQKLHRKNASGEYDLVHMETDTQIVLMNSGSTLEDELLAILAEIERRGG